MTDILATLKSLRSRARPARKGHVMAYQQAVVEAIAEIETMREAVKSVYYAANWSPDRPVDSEALWATLRDAAGLTPGETVTRVPLNPGFDVT